MSELRAYRSEDVHHERPEVRISVSETPPMYDVEIRNASGEIGVIFAALQPDRHGDHRNGEGTVFFIRYSDGSVGTAGVAERTDEGMQIMSGRLILPGEKYYYGSLGDEKDKSGQSRLHCEREVLGAEAMMGVEGRRFGTGVSRVHGSLELIDGTLIVRDDGDTVDGSSEQRSGSGATIHTALTLQEAPFEKLTQEEQEPRNPRLEKLFAPYVRPDLPPDEYTPGRYKHLFDTTAVPATVPEESQEIKEIHSRQEEYDEHVTEQTKRRAVSVLIGAINADPTLDKIVQKYRQDTPYPELVDMIRTSPDIRYAIGEYFTQKLDNMLEENPLYFGNRIADNVLDKHPDSRRHLPLDDMEPREYAVLLALAMIDGSFNPARVATAIELTSQRGIIGQHRHAALCILDSSARFQSAKDWNKATS